METALLGLLVLGAVAWLWQDSLRAREVALFACRRLCQSYGYQILDDTIALKGIRLTRNRRGTATLARHYVFDFSLDGTDRYRGSVSTVGLRVEALSIPPLPEPHSRMS
ncbi:MAG: DUF3301 domain-containing protein [Gammaproteobacteria bacterium]|nr:DUF3301 domain-containing protein [Gammaproteobacteria bacterium]